MTLPVTTKEKIPFPEISYPTNREIIARAMQIGSHKLRGMLREIGVAENKMLTPKDVKTFRERYID